MMGEEYFRFLNLIESINLRLGTFSYWRYAPSLEDHEKKMSEKIDENPVRELKIFLKKELNEISELFLVNTNCAIVLTAILLRFSYRDDIDNYFATIENLGCQICLSTLEFLKLNNEIRELEDRQMITVKDKNQSLIEWINNVDKSVDYSEIFKTKLVSANNKTYELTQTFINKIINL